MTDFEHDLNTGSIFKNDFKQEERHPDYKGQVNLGGDMKDIALWLRQSKTTGKKYFYVQVSEPYQKAEPAGVGASGVDDDVPF